MSCTVVFTLTLLDECVFHTFFLPGEFRSCLVGFYFCGFLVSLNPLLTFFSHLIDVLDMVDVLIEGSDGLDEEIGFTLNEDMIIQTFPFSAVVPAALEARNILLLQTENGTGTHFCFLVSSVLVEWKWDHPY